MIIKLERRKKGDNIVEKSNHLMARELRFRSGDMNLCFTTAIECKDTDFFFFLLFDLSLSLSYTCFFWLTAETEKINGIANFRY